MGKGRHTDGGALVLALRRGPRRPGAQGLGGARLALRPRCVVLLHRRG
uniref:Uncharacterized protein n=1 Tax=Arundo donax TaxID=35708 RepID=A0A0A9HBA5_ARUDO